MGGGGGGRLLEGCDLRRELRPGACLLEPLPGPGDTASGGSLPVGQVVSCPEAGTVELETASQRTSQPPASGAAHWRRLSRWNKAAIALRDRKNNKYHFLTVDPMFSKSFTYI